MIERLLNRNGRIGGNRVDSLVGKNIRDVLPTLSAERALTCIRATIATGEQRTLEFETNHSGGAGRHYESRYVAHREKRVLCIVRDISERIAPDTEVPVLDEHSVVPESRHL